MSYFGFEQRWICHPNSQKSADKARFKDSMLGDSFKQNCGTSSLSLTDYIVFECERYHPGRGFSTVNLKSLDSGRWIDSEGRPSQFHPEQSSLVKPTDWIWSGDWYLDSLPEMSDLDYWQYGRSFQTKQWSSQRHGLLQYDIMFNSLSEIGSNTLGVNVVSDKNIHLDATLVRRRIWYRRRLPLTTKEDPCFIENSNTSTTLDSNGTNIVATKSNITTKDNQEESIIKLTNKKESIIPLTNTKESIISLTNTKESIIPLTNTKEYISSTNNTVSDLNIKKKPTIVRCENVKIPPSECKLVKGPIIGGKNCWSEPIDEKWNIRSKNYKKNGVKIVSEPAAFKLVDIDFAICKEVTSNPLNLRAYDISRHPDSFISKAIKAGVTSNFLVVVFQMAPHYMSVTFEIMEESLENDPIFNLLWNDFLEGTNEYRNSRFKIIPRMIEGSGNWMMRRVVGSKPVLLATKLSHRYFNHARYFEIDCDVNANYVANSIITVLKTYCYILDIDIGFCFEGQNEKELPERIWGTFRLNQPDLNLARDMDYSCLFDPNFVAEFERNDNFDGRSLEKSIVDKSIQNSVSHSCNSLLDEVASSEFFDAN